VRGHEHCERNQAVTVVATPSDGSLTGAPRTANPVQVLNSKPTRPTVVVSPTAPIAGLDDLVCTLGDPSTDGDGDPITYEFRWRRDDVVVGSTTSTPTSEIVPAGIVANLERWYCEGRAYDGSEWGPWSDPAVIIPGEGAPTSCEGYGSDLSGLPNGVYTLDPDGPAGIAPPYDAYCDFSTAGGGWTRVVRTTGQSHNFGQDAATIVAAFAEAGAETGVYEAFDLQTDFDQVMLKAVSGVQAGAFARYTLVGTSGGDSLLTMLEACRDETEVPNDDLAWQGTALGGHTSSHSGQRQEGTLVVYDNISGTTLPADYFFVCGVSTSSDNDVAYIAFADSMGDSNVWSDSWRYAGQRGTIWAFANNDYYTTSYSWHIGHGTSNLMDGYAGWKGTYSATIPNSQYYHQGTYEVFVR